MAFGPDLSRWFGSGAFLGSQDVEALKNIVHDYHTTMDNVREAADSVSYLARGIGHGLRGLGITGPWQELGNPLSDNPANNAIGSPSVVTPAQESANAITLFGGTVPDFMVSNNPTDPYTVTPAYVAEANKAIDATYALPREAATYVSDTVSKYFHYALIAGIVVGVVIFLPEIKAVTRTLRRVAE